MEFGAVAPVGQSHMFLQPPVESAKNDLLPDGTRVYLAHCGSASYISYASGMQLSRLQNGTAFVNSTNGDFWFGFDEIWMRVN